MQNMSGGKTALGLDTNVGALLCYLPVCGISLIYSIIVLVTEKNDRAMRFHAVQSLIMSVVFTVVFVGLWIFTGIVTVATGSSLLGGLFSLVLLGVFVAFAAAMIFGCIKGYQGQKIKFPVIGDMAEKWAG